MRIIIVLLKDAKIVITTTDNDTTGVFQKLHAKISFFTLTLEGLDDVPLAFDVVHFGGFPGAIGDVFAALVERDAFAFFFPEIVRDLAAFLPPLEKVCCKAHDLASQSCTAPDCVKAARNMPSG